MGVLVRDTEIHPLSHSSVTSEGIWEDTETYRMTAHSTLFSSSGEHNSSIFLEHFFPRHRIHQEKEIDVIVKKNEQTSS